MTYDPCAMLSELQNALVAILSGHQRAEVRFGDQTLRYHNANVKELRAEIRRLESICGATLPPNSYRGRAVQVGPRRVTAAGFDRNR